ncbi:MAG TPA: DUF2950 family protein [Candidatus Acidoferrales bacterium]|nr:DUF2950 family protein [Candidatus Acidoferrales bacterium]
MKKASPVDSQPDGKSFASPEDASAALYAAAHNDDEPQLLVVLGPTAKEILHWSDDPEVRAQRRAEFVQKYDQMHRLVKEPDGTVALYVGSQNWPLPIPLVEYKGSWYFDSELGEKEIMFRRIGRNETEALQVCQALVEAEEDYYASNHAYTMKFVSDGSARDGLYWPNGSPKSPIGPYLAHAGVGASGKSSGEPYHGYYYRILSDQNGGASAGFAILAFPADYQTSGVMSFIMDSKGDAYEKDLGAKTADTAKEITSYNPDSSWKKTE